MTSLIHLLTLLALTRGETFLTKHEVLDMMEDLEARYNDKMLTLEASYNERLESEKEEIRTLVASEVSRTRELGQVMMCVYRYHWTSVASTITYDRYIDPNYNNGGRADMNLHTGVFTCLTPGFYHHLRQIHRPELQQRWTG